MFIRVFCEIRVAFRNKKETNKSATIGKKNKIEVRKEELPFVAVNLKRRLEACEF